MTEQTNQKDAGLIYLLLYLKSREEKCCYSAVCGAKGKSVPAKQ